MNATVAPLRFDEGSPPETHHIRWSDPNDPYLMELRAGAALDALGAGCDDPLDLVCRIVHRAHGLWEHDGSRQPSRPDPLTILNEAHQGGRFRCVEYSILIAASLTALGVPTRVLGLKTADVETRESGAGHLACEAYLADRGAWVFADGQWDAVALRDGRPLDAVALQRAIAAADPQLQILSRSALDVTRYLEWLAPYLYYFDVALDNRFDPDHLWGTRLMLLPLGAPPPTVFQRHFPIGDLRFTHSPHVFYAPPPTKEHAA